MNFPVGWCNRRSVKGWRRRRRHIRSWSHISRGGFAYLFSFICVIGFCLFFSMVSLGRLPGHSFPMAGFSHSILVNRRRGYGTLIWNLHVSSDSMRHFYGFCFCVVTVVYLSLSFRIYIAGGRFGFSNDGRMSCVSWGVSGCRSKPSSMVNFGGCLWVY